MSGDKQWSGAWTEVTNADNAINVAQGNSACAVKSTGHVSH